jgi:hypothetical protein
LENEEYLNQYHEYLQQLVDEYVNSGRFEETYNRIRSQIDELVATDPTAFYTEEEYRIATELLYKTVMLRAESVDGQLEGTIPSTDAGQRTDTSSLVDASDIDVKLMGQMNMGGSGGFREFRPDRFNNKSDETEAETSAETTDNMPNMGGFDPKAITESENGSEQLKNLAIYGGCLGLMLVAMIPVLLFKRRR